MMLPSIIKYYWMDKFEKHILFHIQMFTNHEFDFFPVHSIDLLFNLTYVKVENGFNRNKSIDAFTAWTHRQMCWQSDLGYHEK